MGIGASAGGLDAFADLLRHLTADAGLAIVFVHHLASDHERTETEILSRTSRMPVSEGRDGMRIQENHVYILPPQANMGIKKGALCPKSRTDMRSRHMPVDSFFESLAQAQKHRAIGVVLSGTGSDGTMGLGAIEAEGGCTFAQDERSAKHDGMPRSAVKAGVVDFVLPPKGIADELLRIATHPSRPWPPVTEGDDLPAEERPNLRAVFSILRTVTGVDFSYYKPSTIKRRIGRRMAVNRMDCLADYLARLEENPAETKALYEDMLINVTKFFRDPEAFSAVKEKVLPLLMKDRSPEAPLRVWVPGCSTGEEAYSLGVLLVEYLRETGAQTPVQILATDIDESVLEQARAGLYREDIALDVSGERLQSFFVKVDGGYQIDQHVRDICVFARQDVTKDPPFSHLDLISCRNLLIYMDPVMQHRIISTFHFALKPGGMLFLGASETIGESADLFRLVDRRSKIYGKKSTPHRPSSESVTGGHGGERVVPAATSTSITGGGFDAERQADWIVLARYGPAGVVIDEDLNIVQFRGEADRYLTPAAGAASPNLLRMAREGLRLPLQRVITDARRENAALRTTALAIQHDGHTGNVDIDVVPLMPSPASRARHFLVLFHAATPTIATPVRRPARGATKGDHPDAQPKRAEMIRLWAELEAYQEVFRADARAQQITNEGLHAALEELRGTNEELQTTNEELASTQEELQSLNEELTAANGELASRNRELTLANDHLAEAIVAAAPLPLLLLDDAWRVKKASHAFTQAFHVPPEQAEDRIVFDLGGDDWDRARLARLLEDVLANGTPLVNHCVDGDFPVAGSKQVLVNADRLPRIGGAPHLVLLAIEEI